MLHAAERYSRAALERALIRLFEAAIAESVEPADLPDDMPTDLQDSEGEPLTLGCLIEDLHHEARVTDDEGNGLAITEVPEEMFVSRADGIRAWRIGKQIDAGENVSEADVAFFEDVNARKEAYREHQRALRDAERDAEESGEATPKESDVQAALRTLKAAGLKATVVKAEPAVAETTEEPTSEPVRDTVTERVANRLRREGLRRKDEAASEEAEPVAASA